MENTYIADLGTGLKASKAVNLEVRSRLSVAERQMVKRAGLDGLAKVEAWTAIGTNTQLSYSTHGLVRFFGKFPPPIASYLIESYTGAGDVVLDPMSGSGTTGVECLLRSRKAELRDVNPLMLLYAKVKTTYISHEKLLLAFDSIQKEYRPKKFNFQNLSGIKNPEHWFLTETTNSLYGIKILIDKIEDDKIKNFFLACFCSIIRRVSRATTQQGRMFLDVETAEKDAFEFFEKKVLKAAVAVSKLPKNGKQINIVKSNIMEVKKLMPADLIILHPPYFNSYRYSSVNSLELFWLGLNHADVRKSEVREFFKVGKPENYIKFVEDMSLGLQNAYANLKVGGHLAFMMGDTFIKGKYLQVIKETLEAANLPGSKIKTIALRIPKYTEASWAASQRREGVEVGINICDFVVVIEKNV